MKKLEKAAFRSLPRKAAFLSSLLLLPTLGAAQSGNASTFPYPPPPPASRPLTVQQRAYVQQMAAANSNPRIRESHVPLATPIPRGMPAPVHFDGRYVAPSPFLPVQLQYLINAANCLQKSPYARGGGHRRVEDFAYDCSSATSYVLIKGGMLRSPLTSKSFATYGHPGPGRFVTIWVKPGDHVFMTICGVRLDTSGGKRTSEGPRWRSAGRSTAGFFPRHPPGF